jgi:O-antigen/teichoic acid export membrane protein
MARLLSVAEYGILATLFAMIYIFDVFKESIQTVITKYSSKEKNLKKLKDIFNRSTNKALIISTIVYILYLLFSLFLSPLLKIDYSLLALNGLLIFTSSLIPISRGIMLGRKKFKSLGFNMVTESTLKLVLAISFVLIGWKVYGAIAATFIGALVAFMFSFSSLKEIIHSKTQKAKTNGIYNYSIPVFFITTIIIVFYSLDVIIAKIVFSPELAGYYALASILGKTVFWGTQPISRAMFPMSAESKDKKDNHLFINALGMLLGLIVIALVLFYLFPDLILGVFSGKEDISQASSILFPVGLAFGMQSIANLILLNKLSLGKIKGYLYFSLFLIIEAVLLFKFSSSLLEFSMSYIFASLIFLLGSIILLRK